MRREYRIEYEDEDGQIFWKIFYSVSAEAARNEFNKLFKPLGCKILRVVEGPK